MNFGFVQANTFWDVQGTFKNKLISKYFVKAAVAPRSETTNLNEENSYKNWRGSLKATQSPESPLLKLAKASKINTRIVQIMETNNALFIAYL